MKERRPAPHACVPSGKRRIATALASTVILAVALAGCSSTTSSTRSGGKTAEIDPKLGVAPSPRVVAFGDKVPKGGGKSMVGKPYKVAGKRYVPKLDPDYKAVGLASWYGNAFHGRRTANGEVFDSEHLSAAHPTMPLPSYARVTSVNTGRSVVVRVNDRGPFHSNRLIDISRRTADVIGVRSEGIAKVKVEYIGPAPTQGDDTEFLMASYRGPQDVAPPLGQTMIASAEALPGVAARTTVNLAGSAASAAKGLFSGSKSAEPAAAPEAPPVADDTIMVAEADPPPVGPPVAGDVLPPARPGVIVDAYVMVASVDPADAFLATTTTVAAVDLSAVTAVGYTPASFQVGAQPVVTDAGIPLPPLPPIRRSYAEDRVNLAYAAVEGMAEGVPLAELSRRLERLSTTAAASDGVAIQVGIFAQSDNATRIAAALDGIGTVSVEVITVDGRPLSRVRLTALLVPAEEAVAAAERAGASGARLVR